MSKYFLFIFQFSNLRVDEIEEANYNDRNFWTGSTQKNFSADELAEIFGDLAIN
jgi:hypothetical protein